MEQRLDWTLTEALDYDHGRGDPFAAAVRSTRMAMIITDPNLPDNPIVFANRAFQQLTGYERHEVMGRNCRFLQGGDTDRRTVARLGEAIAKGHDVSVDLLNYRKDGSRFWNALFVSSVRDDEGRIKFFFASQMDVTARIDDQSRIAQEKARVEAEVGRRMAQLQNSLEAQQLLLHEVDHRVKNNMTMIGSILRLQMREADDPRTKALLRAMMARVDALAAVHRSLYQSEDITRFDIGTYAVNLAQDLGQAHPDSNIRIRADLSRAEVPAGQASAIGLIINEILTQTVAPPEGQHAEAVVTITATTEGQEAQLTIDVDGNRDAAPSGLGALIIARLAAQARCRVGWNATQTGTRLHIAATREST
nr:histidine kinase dimerization/phosphoacceptor domain -containing protein [Paracoccus saliphilus]